MEALVLSNDVRMCVCLERKAVCVTLLSKQVEAIVAKQLLLIDQSNG